MTKPDHNWLLLHFMFWVYIAMVFPGCYILGKRYSDFRVVYAGLLGTVFLFSLLFSVVGQPRLRRVDGDPFGRDCEAAPRRQP